MTPGRPVTWPSGHLPPTVDRTRLQSCCDEALGWPLPGSGATAERFEALAERTSDDVSLGRLVEAHADASAILAELGGVPVEPGQIWGVWAAGPAAGVAARPLANGAWALTGDKKWCSGAGLVSHALVDASTPAGQALFAVDMASPAVSSEEVSWSAQGMSRTDTRAVSFEGVRATAVGEPGDYLTRPGFWAGAAGVAACWHGGTAAVAGRLFEAAHHRDDPHFMVHLGAVATVLFAGHAALRAAAGEIDSSPASDHFAVATALRSSIERGAAEVLDRVGRALGPGPLALEDSHATRVADLTVYIRQHHGERDLADLGRQVADGDGPCACPVRR